MAYQPFYNRRRFLQAVCGIAGSTALGPHVPCVRAAGLPQTVDQLAAQGLMPSVALSLTRLQQRLAQGQRSHKAAFDFTTINGITVEPDGEVILFGQKDGDISLDLDTLTCATRNSFRVGAAYSEASLGVTIDPWEAAADPWRIQKLTVLGMPATTVLSKRFASLDYELKRVSAGLLSLSPDVSSLFAIRHGRQTLCETSHSPAQPETIVHRFWFTAAYPKRPRFLKTDGTVLILKPVGVQLLSEREYLNVQGKRQGATTATPNAAAFAADISRLLASGQAPKRYRHLVKDFQLIEVTALLRVVNVPVSSLDYLLYQHPLKTVEVPRFVGGIRRELYEEAVCGAEIVERRVPQGIEVQSQEHIARRQVVSRGGVEARIRLTAEQFSEGPRGLMAKLRQRIRDSRPSRQTLQWTITA